MQLVWKQEPDARLAGLKRQLEKRILAKAIKAGAKLVRDDLKATAPSLTGALRQSFSIKTVAKRTNVVGIVGPRRSFAKTKGGRFSVPAWYAHLVEKGHGGKKPAPPHPFLEPSWDRHKQEYIKRVAEEVEAGIAAQLAK